MSKVGQWVFEMQEAAQELTREEFVDKYGAAQASVWDEVWLEADYSVYDNGI